MPEFLTERLVLRPFNATDHDALQAMLLDPQVVAYLRYRTLTTPAAFDDSFQTHFLADTDTTFALENRQTHELVGFYEFHEDGTTGILTYALAPAAWGHGYVAESGLALMQYGFETLGFDELQAHYADANPNSGRVMAKMGMHDMGVLKAKTLPDGQTIHVMAYNLMKPDWQDAQSASA
ncbi:acetyltransferase (putative) [Lactobacillus plantarum JDM1] [Lactiplantibacillus mudanjiangensis]|uniref:GNAT family N-acetyltransferase n=1 Tax=Lactiplantibacillus mudanjiangensis TaxID=1296538 RepID=UPI001013E2CE|nr:acetyltransferase (putative) [Lactobacillus plantarum JDM1] [Lactiplantibacillus mudanjiangensis]